MPRLSVWVPLKGDAELFVTRLQRNPVYWLPPPAEPRGPGHWAVEMRAGPVSRLTTCMVGEAAAEDETLTRRIRWRADPEPGEGDTTQRALPSFEGMLLFKTATGGQPEIHLDGNYRAPRGAIGAALTPAQIQKLAEAAADRFLTQIGIRLGGVDEEEEEQEERGA